MRTETYSKIDSIHSYAITGDLSPLLLLLLLFGRRDLPGPCHSLPPHYGMTAPAIFKPPTPTTVEEPPIFLSAHPLELQLSLFKFRGQGPKP